MSKITGLLWRWGPALLMMAVIFGFSSIPSTKMPMFSFLDLIIKKGGHALGYGLLALFYLRGFKGDSKDLKILWLYLAWMMALVYSVTDEFHQSFVTGRQPAATDVLIDALGATIALILGARYHQQKQPAKQIGRNQ